MRPPALVPAIAALSGCVAATHVEASFRWALLATPLLLTGAAIAWRCRAPRATALLTAAGFAAAALALAADVRQGALVPTLREVLDRHIGGFLIHTLGPEADHDPMPIRAVLREDAAMREDYVSLRVEVTTVRPQDRWRGVSGAVALTVSGEVAATRAHEWTAGRTIEAPAAFRRPARYLNDGVPDFERQLALNGTTLFASVKSGLLVDVVSSGSWFDECAARIRARVRRAVNRWIAPHDEVAAAIVAAVLIGDRTGLPDEVNERLQRAGTYHVIAISGGNIAILAGLVVGALALAGVHGRSAAVATLAVLLVYAQIAVTGPSVWRATLMAAFYLAARVIDHRMPVWQAVTLAAAAMALAAPLDVRSAGFILTFGATGALVESARWMMRLRLPLSRTARPRTRRPDATSRAARTMVRWVAGSIAASIAVELVLMPVSAEVFSRVTLAGPMLNLAAVPLMAVAQMAGLVVAAGDAWPLVARPSAWLAFMSASGIIETARVVDLLPALSWRVPPPGIPLLALYYGALCTVALARPLKLRLPAACVCAVALLVILRVFDVERTEPVGGLRLTMMDVGQGEALLVESGRSRLQIDAGGLPFGSRGFDVGARVLAPAMWARGIRSIDALLLTHGDPDHIGGAPQLLDIFRPPALWEGIVVPAHASSADVRRRAVDLGTTLRARRAGESFAWGTSRIRVLHPPEPDWERPRVRNDDSVVLEVTCGDVALLVTGDIGGEVEQEIAPLLTPAPTRILKVGHHGSRTSSSTALLDAWRPHIALISAGRGNTFGHPAPEVLERLNAIGARIYRTDRDGQITMDTDCRHVVVRTFNEKGP